MAFNKNKLGKLGKALAPGHTVKVSRPENREDLAYLLKLKLEGKEASERNILIMKMEAYLSRVPEEYRPFMEAILEMYKQQLPKIRSEGE